MPHSALHICSYPGCTALVAKGRCAKHTHQDNAYYHDPISNRLYGSPRWKKIRAKQLADEPWCKECLDQGNYVPATDVDHVEPHRGDPVKFFTGKLQSLCHACHSRKTAGEVLNV